MKNKNLPLVIGILIPILFILVFAGFVYIPRVFIEPGYDFIYTTRYRGYNNECLDSSYRVIDEKIEMEQAKCLNIKQDVNYENSEIYLYDIENNISKLISYEEAETLKLISGPSSPDGYVIEYKNRNSGIFELFGDSSNERGYYIGDGNNWEKLIGIPNDRYYYNNDFELIGWVK
jgi:hypothetical protein